MTKLTLEKLDLWYGKTHAVNNLNLIVDDGEFCVLLGPSGCGKTSTLRMIAGLVHPNSGRVYIDDEDVTDLYPGNRSISMIFQDYALYPNKTVREHLIIPLNIQNLSKEEMEKRIEKTAKFLDMEDLLNRYPSELSAGQRQRAATGRALIRRPRLFLMDEPLGNVDERLRGIMRVDLKKLQKELGITTIYVTHDQVEAQSLGDKIVVMDSGVIKQVGTPYEVYSSPKDLFVAGFIGTPPINFFDCCLDCKNGETFIDSEIFSFSIDPRIAKKIKKLPSKKPLVLGIRPENVVVGKKNYKQTLKAKVYIVESEASDYIITLKIEDYFLKMKINKSEIGFKPRVDQDIGILFDQNYMHLFDKENQASLL